MCNIGKFVGESLMNQVFIYGGILTVEHGYRYFKSAAGCKGIQCVSVSLSLRAAGNKQATVSLNNLLKSYIQARYHTLNSVVSLVTSTIVTLKTVPCKITKPTLWQGCYEKEQLSSEVAMNNFFVLTYHYEINFDCTK